MAEDSAGSKLFAIGYWALAFGFFVSGMREWARTSSTPRLGGATYPGRVVRGLGDAPPESLRAAYARTAGTIKTSKTLTVYSIEQRAAIIAAFVRRESSSRKFKEAVAAILSRKCGGRWCVDPKNYAAESDALFTAVVDPKSPYAVRYTLDHPILDQYTSPAKTMSLRIGDCDDLVSYLGAFLGAAGHRPELVVMQAKGQPDWSHILLREPISATDGVDSAGEGEYRYLDPSMQFGWGWKAAGWEPPGLSRVLMSSRDPGHQSPAGIVMKAKVIRIF